VKVPPRSIQNCQRESRPRVVVMENQRVAREPPAGFIVPENRNRLTRRTL
jgi:hypothetical protein